MRTVLCVAEKPSIAKKLVKSLGSKYKAEPSPSKYNWNYTTRYSFGNNQCKIVITSVIGHIQEMYFPLKYKDWQRTNPKELLQRAEVLNRDIATQEKVIQNLMQLAASSSDLFL